MPDRQFVIDWVGELMFEDIDESQRLRAVYGEERLRAFFAAMYAITEKNTEELGVLFLKNGEPVRIEEIREDLEKAPVFFWQQFFEAKSYSEREAILQELERDVALYYEIIKLGLNNASGLREFLLEYADNHPDQEEATSIRELLLILSKENNSENN